MPIPSTRISVRILLASTGLVALVAVGAPARLERSPGLEAVPQSRKTEIQALPILFKVGGFVPREITRPAGDYLLSIGNLSNVKEVKFRLEAEHGARLKEVKARRQKPWREVVRLTPGTYLLTEEDHPEWVCRITVTPR